MDRVILLNADYTYLNILPVQRAICLVVKGKAEVIKNTKKILSNFEGTYKIAAPAVIKLVKFVRMMFKKEVPLTRRNIFVRDEYTCQYCGKQFNFGSKSLTIDHIRPRAKGGGTSWENCVTACKECNSYKGDKKLSDLKMTYNKKPIKPTIGEFINIRMKALGIDKTLDEIMKDLT